MDQDLGFLSIGTELETEQRAIVTLYIALIVIRSIYAIHFDRGISACCLSLERVPQLSLQGRIRGRPGACEVLGKGQRDGFGLWY